MEHVQTFHMKDSGTPAFFILCSGDDILIPSLDDAPTPPTPESPNIPRICHQYIAIGGKVDLCKRDHRRNGEDAETMKDMLWGSQRNRGSVGEVEWRRGFERQCAACRTWSFRGEWQGGGFTVVVLVVLCSVIQATEVLTKRLLSEISAERIL